MHPGIGAHVYLPNLPTFAIMLPLILLKYPCIVFLFAKFSTLGLDILASRAPVWGRAEGRLLPAR